MYTGSMNQYDVTWYTTEQMSTEHQALACRQVYVWLITSDNNIAIVSKNGTGWQLPGGKPDVGESLIETAVREVREETGLDVLHISHRLQFFGYQTVTVQGQQTAPFIQVRFALFLDESSTDITLHLDNEDNQQANKDKIVVVKAVPLAELTSYIPWLQNSPELTTFSNIPRPLHD